MPLLVLVTIAGLLVGGFLLYRAREQSEDRKAAAARAYVDAYAKRDYRAMYALLDARSRKAYPTEDDFLAAWRQSDRAATVRAVSIGKPGRFAEDRIRLRVTVRTRDFGRLRGTFTVRAVDEDETGRVAWDPSLRLPGLRKGEEVVKKAGARPTRGRVVAADGSPLDPGIAGEPAAGGKPATGLNRIHDDRLAGRPSSTLRFGRRVIKRVSRKPGRSVRATIRPGLQQATLNALGNKFGGIAVMDPRDGRVLALAGIAVSAPQAPGSTFKIITAAAALNEGVAKASSTYPVQTATRLSGVTLRNAGNESCGGSLANSFVHSCNSVFAPLGVKLGRKRLLEYAERFGFNQEIPIPALKPSTIPEEDLDDAIAIGSAAIGQNTDLATPLQMASVGATIANRGVRIRPRITTSDPIVRKRVVKSSVAAQVRGMMVGVVRGGTGTAAAVPGVTVAGKTGTAELVNTVEAGQNAANTNAWFVAFAPAEKPRVAVAVLLVRSGQGGASAAPVAKRVLQAAL